MTHETALLATIAVKARRRDGMRRSRGGPTGVSRPGSVRHRRIFGFVAARLRAPPLVGYLLAGVAVGPFTPGFVANAGLASELAGIGVILLMFGVGLHFSIRDLLAVRAIALPGAIARIAAATVLGAGLAMAWGWSAGAGLVFGLALSVASTVVLLRALEARGRLASSDGRIRWAG